MNSVLLLPAAIILFGFVITTNCKSTESFTITSDETKAAAKLREVLGNKLYKNYMRADIFLIRWLRSEKGNLQTTKSKLENTIKWRLDNQIDGILKEDFSDLKKACPFFISGRDKEKSPKFSMNQCSIRKISIAGELERLKRFIYQIAEALATEARSNATNSQYPEQIFFIADSQGFNVREHLCLACFAFYRAMNEAFTIHYPELFKIEFAINFSRNTETLLNLAFRDAGPSTPVERHRIFGYDRNEWLPALLKYVDLDQLSPTFGGKASKRLL